MKAFTNLAVAFTLFLVVTNFTPSSCRLFTYINPATLQPCILVDVAFAIDITAEKDNELVGEKSFTSEETGITVQGSCGEISSVLNLFFPQRMNFVFKFTMDEAGQVTLDRLVQFVPEKVFGETVPVGDVQTMDDPGTTALGGANNSYTCSDLDIAIYDPITITTQDFNFTVIVAVEKIKAQAFNVVDGNFSEALDCQDFYSTTPDVTTTTDTTMTTPKTTTTATGNTTSEEPTTTATTEPTTTTKRPPAPGIPKYIVQDGDITCITLEAMLKLRIIYPLTKGGRNTAIVDIPKNAVTNGNCELTKTTQSLKIEFFNGWFIEYTFEDKENQDELSATKHSEYEIKKVGLEFVTNPKIFPGMKWQDNITIALSRSSSDFPKVSADEDFYRCDSKEKTDFSSTVSMETVDLRFRAFNTDGSQNFDGVEKVCSADTSSTSAGKAGVIVGVALGVILLLCIIAFVFLYVARRRRNAYRGMA